MLKLCRDWWAFSSIWEITTLHNKTPTFDNHFIEELTLWCSIEWNFKNLPIDPYYDSFPNACPPYSCNFRLVEIFHSSGTNTTLLFLGFTKLVEHCVRGRITWSSNVLKFGSSLKSSSSELLASSAYIKWPQQFNIFLKLLQILSHRHEHGYLMIIFYVLEHVPKDINILLYVPPHHATKTMDIL